MYISLLGIGASVVLFFFAVQLSSSHPYAAVLCSCYGFMFGGYVAIERDWCRLERQQWESIGYGVGGAVAGVAFFAGARQDLVILSILLGLCSVVDWVLQRVGVLPLWDTE
jgi:hypothetical protein